MVPSKRVERLYEGDKITRDEPCSLMNQLVEGMLTIGPWFAPIDWPGIIGDPGSIKCHLLAVALHCQLLQIGWESFQVLLIGQDGDGLGAKKVIVPRSKERRVGKECRSRWSPY